MVAQRVDPIQLSNYQDDPRGRRYSDLEREQAYVTWRYEGRRSFTKTSELTTIAVNTLRSWHQSDGWAERADTEDSEAIEMVRVALAAEIVDEATKSLDTIKKVRDDASAPHKVRLDAAIWVMGVLGVSPIAKTANLERPAPPAPAENALPSLDAIDFDNLTPAEQRQALLDRERQRRASRFRPEQ